MKNQRGAGFILVAFVVVLILVIAAVSLSYKNATLPTSVPVQKTEIDQASSELDEVDVDNSLDTEITEFDVDSSSF